MKFFNSPYNKTAPEKVYVSKNILSTYGTIIVSIPEPAEVIPSESAIRLSKYGPKAVKAVKVTIPDPRPKDKHIFSMKLKLCKIILKLFDSLSMCHFT